MKSRNLTVCDCLHLTRSQEPGTESFSKQTQVRLSQDTETPLLSAEDVCSFTFAIGNLLFPILGTKSKRSLLWPFQSDFF